MEFTLISRKIELGNKKIVPFNEVTDLIPLRKLIFKSIEICYSGFYDLDTVQLFKEFHKIEDIKIRAKKGNTILCILDKKVVGTGTLCENHINAMFTDPMIQRQGIGKRILFSLLYLADNKGFKSVTIESNPGSKIFYEKLGFKYLHDRILFNNHNQPIVHFVMEKHLI